MNFKIENHPTPEKHLIETMVGGLVLFDYNTTVTAFPTFSPPISATRLFRFSKIWVTACSRMQPTAAGSPRSPRRGWTLGVFDLNNNGRKDLFTASSHVDNNLALFEASTYRQPNSILANLGGGPFADATPEAGKDFQVPWAHRGAAFADLNRDGRIDIVTSAL